MKKVFVYGTLKKGGALHGALNTSKFIKETSIKGFSIFNYGWFPAVVKSENAEEEVFGELYEVTDAVSKDLDMIEGYPNLYQKESYNGMTFYYMEDKDKVRDKEQVKNNNWNVNGNN